MYVTGVFSGDDFRSVPLQIAMKQARTIQAPGQPDSDRAPYEDPISGLRSATSLGRPDWSHIFEEVRTSYPGKSVGVFACGPRPISQILRKNCEQFNGMAGGTKFEFHKENF
jgi:hypothetical protein